MDTSGGRATTTHGGETVDGGAPGVGAPGVGAPAGPAATTLSRVLAWVARSSLVRYLVVGVLSFVADAGALYVFHGRLRVALPLAAGLAFGVAFVVNFGLNRIWSFRAAGSISRQLRRYLYLVTANLVLTVALVPGLAWLGLPYLVAKAGTTGLLTLGNYGISQKWVFR